MKSQGSPLMAILGTVQAIALNTTEGNTSYPSHELMEISRALRSASNIIDGEVFRRDNSNQSGRVA